MTLKNWQSKGWLKRQPTNRQEIQDLLNKVDRDITEAAKEEITPDWRLAIAYNACLGCAAIALRASGYRMLARSGHHRRTIQSLRHTFQPDNELIISLEAISKKRAMVSYDAAGRTTEAEVEEALNLAIELKSLLIDWLRRNFKDLINE